MGWSPAATAAALVVAAAGAMTVTGCSTTADTDAAVAPTAQVSAVVEPADQVTNGIAALPPDEALAQSRDALGGAQSFRVAGSPSRGAPLDLVFVSTDDTVGSTGTVTQGGSTFELLAIGDDVYVRGNLDWLADTVDEKATRTIGEKWLLLPEGVGANLSPFVDPDALIDSLLVPTGPVQSVGVSLIDEQPAQGIRLVDTEGTIWLSGIDEPYPLLIERLGATATDGVLRFSEVDAEVDLAAPPAEDVVTADIADSADTAEE